MAANVLKGLMRDENATTRLLVALCQLKPVREVIIRQFTLGTFGADEVGVDDISDQVTLEGEQPDTSLRPDIYIGSESTRILVEVKTSPWTVLQETQPKGYFAWLHRQDKNLHRYLVFLMPPGYQHLQAYTAQRKDFFTENEGVGIHTPEIDWLEIARVLESEGLAEAIPYVWDFCDALRSWYLPEKIAFNNTELSENDMFNKDAIQALAKILSLIEQMAVALERSNSFVVEKSLNKRWWENSEYGFYVKQKVGTEAEYILWLGVWTDYWQKTGIPLSIGIDKKWLDGQLETQFRACFPNAVEYEGYWVAAIDKHRLMQDAVADIMQWLQPYLAFFANTNEA